jgi:hypothetical protein
VLGEDFRAEPGRTGRPREEREHAEYRDDPLERAVQPKSPHPDSLSDSVQPRAREQGETYAASVHSRGDEWATGASLVGLLMIVVVLGGLSALAVLGVSSLTSSTDTVATITGTTLGTAPGTTVHGPTRNTGIGGVTAGPACAASADAARQASTVYFVSSGAYPTKWSDLLTQNPPNFLLPAGVIVNPGNPAQLEGNGWTMDIAGAGTAAPTFTCTP